MFTMPEFPVSSDSTYVTVAIDCVFEFFSFFSFLQKFDSFSLFCFFKHQKLLLKNIGRRKKEEKSSFQESSIHTRDKERFALKTKKIRAGAKQREELWPM